MSLSALLAVFADLYTPFLAAFYLKRLYQSPSSLRASLICLLLANLGIAWGLMFIDQAWTIWPAWKLDYSTHTAVAVAFIVGLCVSAPRQSPYWGTSLVFYAALMMALDYHSLADVISTAVVAGAPMLALGLWRCRTT